MKKKIAKLQIFRIAIQIIFLILLPGLFTLTFSQLGKIYSMIIRGQFNFVQAFPSIVAAITIILITIIFGRFFCGWLCAFGAFNDFLYIISKNIFGTNIKISEKLDSVLKYLKYIILLFIVFFIWTKASNAFDSSSPWNAFAQITQFPQSLYDYTMGFIILALIGVGAALIERFFCRYLCPLGAIFTLVSKAKIFKINKPTDKCGKCRMCTNNCAMGIPLYKNNKVKSGECINCFKCIEVCPRKNTQVSICDENINAALASSIAITAFVGAYTVNNMVSTSLSSNNAVMSDAVSTSSTTVNSNNSINNSTSSSTAKYKDGTYTGTGHGFRPGLQVAVTVKSGRIANIEITSINDTPGYYEEPVNTIPKEIVGAQSTNVDAVSGATRTSNGIMMAVEDALNKAKVN